MPRRSSPAALRTAVACLAAVAASASAQGYPARPVQVVVPFAPTGSTSIIFRALAPQLGAQLGQPVLLINRPGGAATIGMNSVAKSAPDGYTLGVATLSFAANPPFMQGRMPFDTEKDLVPVAMVARLPMVLTIHPSVSARSVAELVALARSKPGALNYGSAGVASSGHLGGALFEALAGVRMTHVPYSSTGSAAGLVGGQTQLQIAPIPSSLGFIKSKQVIALGVTSLDPDPVLPGVPPIADTVPGYEVFEFSGIVAPTGTPRPVIVRVEQAVLKSLEDADVRQHIAGAGAHVAGGTADEFGAFLKKELAKWRQLGAEVRKDSAEKP